MLAKHYKIGVSAFFVFLLFTEKKKGPKKLIIGISGFGFFGPKMAVSWRIPLFQKMPCWNPCFYSEFWVRAFWAKLSKKEILDTHQKINIWLIAEKLIFLYLLVFLVFFSQFFVFFVFVVFFLFLLFSFLGGGFKGQARWPEGPPHLALNPPFLFLLFVSLFFFLFICPFFVFNRKTLFSP